MATANNTKTIIIAIAAVAITIIIYLIINKTNSPRHPDEQEAVTCGTKTIYHYKYPSEAYPVFTRDYNSEVSLTTDVLKRISDSLGNAQIGVDAKNKVEELQEKLNQDNITFSTALRSYFMNINPLLRKVNHGNWLQMPLLMKGVPKEKHKDVLYAMIFLFNEMMIDVADHFNKNIIQGKQQKNEHRVFHIDGRGIVPDNGWTDELHPTPRYFKKVASLFIKCINGAPSVNKCNFIYNANDLTE